MKGGFLNQKRPASGSGSSRGSSRASDCVDDPRRFASVQARIGIPFLLQQCKEKLPPGWHERVQHLKELASELQALVDDIMKIDALVNDALVNDGRLAVAKTERMLGVPQKLEHALECTLQDGKKWMRGTHTELMDASAVVVAMGDFHAVQQLRDVGLHEGIRALAAGIVTSYLHLGVLHPEPPTGPSTPPALVPPHPEHLPGAPRAHDLFRALLRIAHHMFAPSYTFLEGSVDAAGKKISFSLEDKIVLEELSADPSLVILALEKWASDGVSKDVQPGENAAQDFLVQLLHSDHSPAISRQLHMLLSSEYAARAFGKCLQVKSLPVLEVAVQLLRRVVCGPKELKAECPWRGVAWEQGLRPFPVFISEAWLPNLIICLQSCTSAHALWSSSSTSQKSLPPSARHKQVEECAKRVGRLIRMVNDCFDLAVNNVGIADIRRQPPPKGSPPSLECDTTRWPDALITAHAGMNFKAMRTFHAKRMEFLTSLRPYSSYGGHAAFKAKGAAQALGSVLDSIPITSLVLSHSPRDLGVLSSLLASASPSDRAALLKANEAFVDTLTKMVLLWAEALCVQTFMDFDKASKSRRSACEYEVLMDDEQAHFDLMVENLWRLRFESDHKPKIILESLSEILNIICSMSPSILPLDHFQNVTILQRLKRLAEGKEMACVWLQHQEVMQPVMKRARSVLVNFKKEFLKGNYQRPKGKGPRTREEAVAEVAKAKASLQAKATAAVDLGSHPGHKAVVDEVEKAVWAEVDRLTKMMEARRRAAAQERRSFAQTEVDIVAMTANQAAGRAIEAARQMEEAAAIAGEGPRSTKIAVAVAKGEVKEAVDVFLQEGLDPGPLAGAFTEATKDSAEAAYGLACKADKLGQEALALGPSPKDEKKIKAAVADAQGAADGAADTVVQLLADAKPDEVLQEMASSADVYKGMAAFAVSTFELQLKKLREGKQAAAATKDAAAVKQKEDGKGSAASSEATATQGPNISEAAAAGPKEGSNSEAASEVQQQKLQQRKEKPEEEKDKQQRAEKPVHVCLGCHTTGVSFKKCSVCHGRYCSVQCQKDNWAEHRKVCRKPD